MLLLLLFVYSKCDDALSSCSSVFDVKHWLEKRGKVVNMMVVMVAVMVVVMVAVVGVMMVVVVVVLNIRRYLRKLWTTRTGGR